ncbi:hypothetical protein [Bradyrhizobium iriomotense]|uniref:Baseplate assembly protein n=1 Tax=Bradyrhizobium iriomotense TaxID=441950 RepID=A0ABQ6B2P7_9BRAD|nr:hypothetical protein [Bradyrhizobium iriomotense]GLR87960.1 putative baseplate assembly protein [Bradyrhizobium iriomotense]
MSCQHDCERPPVFPRVIDNRAGLDSIDYRIGSYADMLTEMLGRINAAPELARFTHRKPDDPAIALLESAAIVGDILSFYQQLYANEAFLRTAQWRDSVADLVKLLGYRLAPGLGGHARFALLATGAAPVAVPQGFGFKAQLDGAPKPASFESSAAIVAYPGLSAFQLYRPRYTPSVVNGIDTFVVSGAADTLSLKAGDKLMVGAARSDDDSLDHSQIVVVDKSWTSFGLRYVKTKGVITCLDTAPSGFVALLPQFGSAERTITNAGELRAYKIAQSYRHFGHAAPALQMTVDADGHPQAQSVDYGRSLTGTTTSSVDPELAALEMPLDSDAASITAGTTLLTEAPFIFFSSLSARGAAFSSASRVVARSIVAAAHRSLAWGGQTGGSIVLTLDNTLAIREGRATAIRADIRNIAFHQVDGEAFALVAAPQPTGAAHGRELYFYGSDADAAVLDGRTVLIAGPGETLAETQASLLGDGPSAGFHRVNLDMAVNYADFSYDAPTVTVYGNLVAATEGKTGDQITLGDGDVRQTFQTFALPKPPLTYLLAPTSDPPQAPELSVYVGGRRWTRVDSFFTSSPRDQVYVVREDAGGNSFVQFGDGKTGARLPSGRGNVTAIFRTGSGSDGPLKAGAKPQADRLAGIDKALMPEPVTGGAAPEDGDSARIAAPGRMQSLARMVSLADIEAEAQAIAGVLKATAVWDISTGLPCVTVTILTQSRSAADANAVAETLRALDQARGAARYPLRVVAGKRLRVHMAATVGYDASYLEDDVGAGIVAALGAAAADGSASANGLFSWQQRRFGEGAHGSQIVGAIQNAPGVRWVELTSVRVGLDHLLLTQFHRIRLPSAEWRAIRCPTDSMLALDEADLVLGLSAANVSEA